MDEFIYTGWILIFVLWLMTFLFCVWQVIKAKHSKERWVWFLASFAPAYFVVRAFMLIDDASHDRFCKAVDGVKVEEQSRKTVITVCTDDWWRE